MKLIHKDIINEREINHYDEDYSFSNNELRESEKNFFQIFEFNPSPMSINDIDTNLIIDVNRAFVKIMEVDSKNDLIGKNTTEKEGLNFLKEKDKSFFFSELKKNGIFENYIFSFKTKSGKKLKGVVSGTIIELNKKNYLLTVCQIISSRCLMRFFNLL